MSVRLYDDYDWGNVLWWMDAAHHQHTTEQAMDDAMALSVLANANRQAYIATYPRGAAEALIVGPQHIHAQMHQREPLKSTISLVGLIGYNCVSNNGEDFLPLARSAPAWRGSGQYPDWTGPTALLYVQRIMLRVAEDHLR